MTFTEADISSFADALLLECRIYIHRKTHKRTIFPLKEKLETGTESPYAPSFYLPSSSNDREYFVLLPPTELEFHISLYTSFLLLLDMPESLKAKLESLITYRRQKEDIELFLSQVLQYETLESWLEHQQAYFRRYVQKLLYLFDEKFLHLQ
jgi:hypothetical protein